ncbi:MAG: peptide-methionine (S)-S-oxide reductase MsrA [Clostridia bacterium]|nr:peptide-methionine (S)-S-oxide reductase MsrA [Clostridia bacterium]
MKKIYLAGGCFWGLQKYMDQFKGIMETTVGYANGKTENPTYEDVKSQQSDHSETVEVVYDESVISLKTILEKYYVVIDPTSLNKQGEDEGRSYRTGIYYTDEADLTTINEVTEGVQAKNEQKVVVEIEPLKNFYPAEEYHQKYLEKNPQGYCHIGGCFFG